MKLLSHEIRIPKVETITIRCITDVHMGNEGFHSKLFDKFLRVQEEDKNSYWICTGDMIDADRPSMRDRQALVHAESERRDAWRQRDKERWAWIRGEVYPRLHRIRHRCLGVLDGDHFMLFENGMTSTEILCRNLKIPYLGERIAYVGLKFIGGTRSTLVYTILARHGKGNSSTSGGDVSSLERQNQGWIADLYLGGHTHKENIHPVQMLMPDKNFVNIKQKLTWYVRGGSFLRGFLAGKKLYPEMAEYNPLATGWCEITLRIGHTTATRIVDGVKKRQTTSLQILESSARIVAS